MRQDCYLLKTRTWGAAALVFILGAVLAWPSPAWGAERIILKFEGGIGGLQLGPYGQASITNKIKGDAWLLATGAGQWQGRGNMTVHTDPQANPSRGIRISAAESKGDFNVTAKVKAGKLEFWFESKPIELKGTISFQAPAPVGFVTEPYTLTFDPASMAPGPPAATDIEMRDGAIKIIDYNKIPTFSPIMSGVMVFTLKEVEEWSVQVSGVETDAFQLPITNKALKPPNTELPVEVSFEWKLIGTFYIVGGKASPTYYDGSVFSASYKPTIYFDYQDLYRCFSCGEQAGELSEMGTRNLTELSGKPIAGQVTSGSVKLTWPEYFPQECVRCKPRKIFLGPVVYTKTFGTKEFLFKISREVLPLKDGATVKGGIKDWMSYTILLKKRK
jgi:hypothetical protein